VKDLFFAISLKFRISEIKIHILLKHYNTFQCKFYFITEISKNFAYLKIRYDDILLEQTKILPNCTSVIQPLNQGIARRFKISINI